MGLDLKQNLDGSILEKNKIKDLSEIYLFISFDLVNATEFKIRNPDWQQTFTNFYSQISKQISNNNNSPIKDAKVWKYIGDEILFYLKISDEKQLLYLLPFLEKIVKETEKTLHSYSVYYDQLFIKTATWIAEIYSDNSSIPKGKAKNIKFESFEKPGYKFEFLGPDIDLGFRIAKYSRKGIIALDGKLAFLLYKYRQYIKDKYKYNIENTIKIVDYKKLKGILRGRLYPIIWYSSNWNIDEIFLYDESINDTNLLNIQKQIKNNTNNLAILEKIFKDTNQEDTTDKTIEIIKKTKNENEFPELKTYAEVHVAIICFFKNKIFAFLRKEDKKILPNIWEFGCGQVKPNESFIDTAVRTYKEDFNLNIEVFNQPVAIYDVEKYNQKIPGIILIGELLDDNIENIQLKGGHNKYELLTLDEIKQIKKDNYVENFQENALKVFKIYNNSKI